ncbi:MAG: DNA repair protein RadC [Eubacterium sp.]|nr:DNA repair protein RadC [Eubacterium sp.]
MNNLRIVDMAENEKPVEKLMQYGAEVLSDAELLAIILRIGTNDISVINLAQKVLNNHPVHKGLRGLNYQDIKMLTEIPGVGKVKASQIKAVAEISKRMSTEVAKENVRFDNAYSIADYFMEECRYLQKERVYALFLNTANSLLYKLQLSEGSVDRSIVSPRELFKEALRHDATQVVIIHNHPSGDATPSDIDIMLTKNIYDMGIQLGIPLIDHIIIGDGVYTSLREQNLM